MNFSKTDAAERRIEIMAKRERERFPELATCARSSEIEIECLKFLLVPRTIVC